MFCIMVVNIFNGNLFVSNHLKEQIDDRFKEPVNINMGILRWKQGDL
jgi:hypothetical protein